MATGSIKKVSNDSASGYCKMPDGTLMQWGTYKTTATSVTQTGSLYMVTLRPNITFPIPFYQDAPKVFLNQYGGYGAIFSSAYNSVGIYSIDIARPTSGTIVPDIAWFAIGRWK